MVRYKYKTGDPVYLIIPVPEFRAITQHLAIVVGAYEKHGRPHYSLKTNAFPAPIQNVSELRVRPRSRYDPDTTTAQEIALLPGNEETGDPWDQPVKLRASEWIWIMRRRLEITHEELFEETGITTLDIIRIEFGSLVDEDKTRKIVRALDKCINVPMA